MFDLVSEVQRAQGVGTPIMAISTQDQQNSMYTLGTKLNGKDKKYSEVPVLGWNCLTGIIPYTDKGSKLLKAYSKIVKWEDNEVKAPNPTEMLTHALNLGNFTEKEKNKDEFLNEDLIFMIENAHRFLEEVTFVQGIMNIREPFKAGAKVLLLLGPSFSLPAELTQDILIIDEPLPSRDEIKDKLTKLFTDNGVKFTPKLLEDSADALKGLSAFPIEQAASLSVRKKDGVCTVELDDLWQRKRHMIEQVSGLSMIKSSESESFDQIGGLYNIKSFIHDLMQGPCKPVIIVYIDEIEKVVAGAGNSSPGDSSGTSQDQMQQILTSMEDLEWTGQINLGPPGSGKSLLAKSIAATYGLPLIKADFGATKGSLVGESEHKIRAMIKAIEAMAGKGGAYFVATCNKLHTLSPELQRRFGFGLFMFDLPDKEERISIGKIITDKKYPTVKNNSVLWENAKGWSGANIRDCCKMAYAFNISVEQAAKRIIPAESRDAEGIKRLRELADGKFLSASYEGTYEKDKETEETSISTNRKFNIK